MANCAKALFTGKRLLRQLFENSNMTRANRYNGNIALLSSCSDFHAILGAKTFNEHLCKSLLMQPRFYSKYSSLNQPHVELECTRLSKLNESMAKPGSNTPLVKHPADQYFNIHGKAEKCPKQYEKFVREPPKSRHNHAYFMHRAIFNCGTTYKRTNTQSDIKTEKSMETKSNGKVENNTKQKIDVGVQAEPVRNIFKKNSVHTLYRKDWDRSESLNSESSCTNMKKLLNCDQYKDLSILLEAPSKHEVSDERKRNTIKETPTPCFPQKANKTNHWQSYVPLQEKLEAKGILKMTPKTHKQEKQEELKIIDMKSKGTKISPLKKETMEIYKAKNSIYKDSLEEIKNKIVKKSKLNDLDPNEVYTDTWNKPKINSLCKFMNITESPRDSPVKAESEEICFPKLRKLHPHEFYDFPVNMRPIQKENTQFSKPATTARNLNNTGSLKPKMEPPFKGFHYKTKIVDEEDSDEKNTYKKNISEALKPIFYEENENFEKFVPNMSVSRIQATYMWVTGHELAVKDRILNNLPKTVRDIPEWTSSHSDRSKNINSNKDVSLVPKQYYKNPLKPKDGSLLILCDTENSDEHMSKRASCLKTIKKYMEEEPWFGFAQEYIVLTMDGKPLCSTRARESDLVKELAQAHVDACLFAGLSFCEMSELKVPGKWEYQIGPSFGINAADDLWVSRYLLKRLAEKRNLQVSFDPKSVERFRMDINTKINFSTWSMRKENGIKHIIKAVNRLSDHHSILNSIYKQRKKNPFTWAIDRPNVCISIPKSTAEHGRGYLQDRRPAGDSDPYEISEALLKVCLKPSESESTA